MKPSKHRKILVEAIARGWCYPENSYREMDVDLALAIAQEIEKILPELKK